MAHHDLLTGLPNRLFLAAHLPLAMEESRKTRTPLAVLFLDLDRFKHVNDTHGHEVGDKLLQEVAQRIQSSVRAEDIVVRMGGDEFVVILNKIKIPRTGQRNCSAYPCESQRAAGYCRQAARHYGEYRPQLVPT